MQSQAKIDRNMLLLDAQALLDQWKAQVVPGVPLNAVADRDDKWSGGIHQELLALLVERLGDMAVTPARVPRGLIWQALETLLERRTADESRHPASPKGKEKAGAPPSRDTDIAKDTEDDGDSDDSDNRDDSDDSDDSDGDEGSLIVNDDENDAAQDLAFDVDQLTFADPGEFRTYLRENMPLESFIRSSRQACEGFVARTVDVGAIPPPALVATGAFPQFSFPSEITGLLVNDTFNTQFNDPDKRDLLLADSEAQRLPRLLATQRRPGRRQRLHELAGRDQEPEGLRPAERDDPEAELPVLPFVARVDEDAAALHRRRTFRRGKGRTRVLHRNRVVGFLPRKRERVDIGIMCRFVRYKVVRIGDTELEPKDQMPLMIGTRGPARFEPFVGVADCRVEVPADANGFTVNLVLESVVGNVLGSSYPRVLLDWRAQPSWPGGAAPGAGVGGRFEIDLVHRTLTAADASTEKYFGRQ